MSDFSEIVISTSLAVFVAILLDKFVRLWRNKELRQAITGLILLRASSNKTFIVYLKIMDEIVGSIIPSNMLLRKIMLLGNASLLSAVARIAHQISSAAADEKKSKTIVGIMLSEKIKTSSKAQLFLITSLVIHFSLVFFSVVEMSGFIIVVVAIGFSAIHIDHRLIEYRVMKGFYGQNEYEAREIINFIISHANKDDFNDGSGGRKKLIPNPEVDLKKNISGSFDGVTT